VNELGYIVFEMPMMWVNTESSYSQEAEAWDLSTKLHGIAFQNTAIFALNLPVCKPNFNFLFST
jgi:hypothetical protein